MSEPGARFLFYYRRNAPGEPARPLPDGYRWQLWRPSLLRVAPQGFGLLPFGLWWLFHCSRLFYNHDYSISLIYHGDKLVHRSVVFPGFFRFPFMERQSLQIGDTWTDESHRGRGLATSGLIHAIRATAVPANRGYWYIVQEANRPSIAVVEKAGLQLMGSGRKQPRAGLSFLGAYRLLDSSTTAKLSKR